MDLSLVIVQGGGPALLGRDWLDHIKLDWTIIAYHTVDKVKLEEMLEEMCKGTKRCSRTSWAQRRHLPSV